jgi:diguanylate cyclase
MSISLVVPTISPERRATHNGPGLGGQRHLRWLWASYGVLGLVLVAYLASLLLRPNGETWTWLDGWVVCAVELVGSLLCLARGCLRRAGRASALVLGFGLLCWTVGDIVLTVESLGGVKPPTPSAADLFYLCFYPLAYVAVVLFMRGEVRRIATPNWLDGAIAGLGAAAVCAAFVFHSIERSASASPTAVLTNLAYPMGDVLLLGLVGGGFAVLSGRRKAPWILLATGLGLNVLGDTTNLYQNAAWGASRVGVTLNSVAWPTAICAMSLAVWLQQRPSNPLAPQRQAGFALPNLAAIAALSILFVGTLHRTSHVAIALATLTLLVVGIRLVTSVRGMQSLSQDRHLQSVTDDLTGLRNRRYLFRVLDAFFAEVNEMSVERTLAFLFVDLNHFKEINDSFGHPAGDELLKQLGSRLSSSLRESDLLVRLGGDEFAVLVIDGDAAYASVVARRLTASLEEPFILDSVSTTITASIGISMTPNDATDAAGLVWCADVAMYRAKLSNQPFATYEANIDDGRDQMRMLEELRSALANSELVLHYQPQLDLHSGEIVAAEALIRWAHPKHGMLPPNRFLSVAEEGGLMQSITRWVLEEAVAQCLSWRSSGRSLSVAVNVSPTNLLEPGFVETVERLLDRHGLVADALVLEITETCVITDFEQSQRVIRELRNLGVVVSIDDFGAGVTSLAYLSNLVVGELKLDRTFIAGLERSDSDRDRNLDLVHSTIDLGHAMGLRIVAEGVEDPTTLGLLRGLGCDLAQGYCIGKPKPASELAFRSDLPAVLPAVASG